MTGGGIGVVVTTLLASGVEFVEALTIVLAMGTTRGWRSAWAGIGAAVLALAALTAGGGYALEGSLPEALLRLVIGALLLLFGLQWLRKAVLRAAGRKALHDEDATFREQSAAARAAPRTSGGWASTGSASRSASRASCSKASRSCSSWSASASAGGRSRSPSRAPRSAAAVVVAAGFALRRPLARVPENTMKFAVGLMLTTFGTFWMVEGLGWLGRDGRACTGPAATRRCRCCSPRGARSRGSPCACCGHAARRAGVLGC